MLLGLAALVAPVFLYTDGSLQTYCLIHSLVYGALLMLTMRLGSWDHRDEISGTGLVTGFALLSLCVLCATFYAPLSYLLTYLKLAVFVYSLLAVLCMNRRGWLLATGGKHGYSRAMRWKNRFLALGMFVLAMIPAYFISPIKMFGKLWDWFRKLVAGYLEKIEVSGSGEIVELESVKTPGSGASVGVQIPIKLLVIALIFIGVILLSVLLVSTLKEKKIKFIYDEDFSDEITRTKREKIRRDVERETREEAQRRPLFFGRMTPAQKIRYRYRQLSRKHPEWMPQNTARENLADPAAGIYEEARYSDHPITDSQVENFKKETKKR